MSDATFEIRPPALRAPARWRDAVRAEMAVLAGTHPFRWLWLILAVATSASSDSTPDRHNAPFQMVAFLAAAMFFVPLVWQGERHRQTSALPIGGVALEVLRLACGAVFAAVVLGLSIATYTVGLSLIDRPADWPGWMGWYAPGTLVGFPTWYPAAVFAVGMAHYLLGSAVMLHSERPERTLPAAFIVGLIVMGLLDMGWVTTELVRTEHPDGEVTLSAGTVLTPTLALLRLGIAAAVMALAVAAAHARRRPRWTLPNPLRSPWRAYAARSRARTDALRVPRPAASLLTVAVRQFVVLAPRMTLPLLAAGFFAWKRWMAEVQAPGGAPAFISNPTPFREVWVLAFLWPVLAWLNEHRTEPWDDARPAGAMEWRLLHAAAGMVWLQVIVLVLLAGSTGGAMAAGTLRSPAELPAYLWLGLPVATLVLYCAGTVIIVLADRPLLAGILGMQLFLGLMLLGEVAMGGDIVSPELMPLSPVRVVAPAGFTDSADWSLAPVLLWTPVFVAAALGAIWRRARRDRHGGSAEGAASSELPGDFRAHRRPAPAR